MNLSELSWPVIAELPRKTPIVLPIAALEQHGRHLPVFTDTLLLGEVVRRVQELPIAQQCLFAPVQWLGHSHHHLDFPGTLSLAGRHYIEMLQGLARCWIEHGFSRLVFLNGHGGNIDALRRAVPRLRHEGRDAAWLSCRTAENPRDTHAGHAETSLMLHLHPDLVRVEHAARGCVRPLPQILPAMRDGGVAAVSPSGVLGDPTTATAAYGERLWGSLVADARARLDGWRPGDDGMLR